MALLPKCSRVTKREVKALALTTVTLTSRSTKSLRLQLPFRLKRRVAYTSPGTSERKPGQTTETNNEKSRIGNTGSAAGWLVKGCWRNDVDEASEHEATGHRARTLRSGHHQKRATLKPHRHQATRAAIASVPQYAPLKMASHR